MSNCGPHIVSWCRQQKAKVKNIRAFIYVVDVDKKVERNKERSLQDDTRDLPLCER